MKPPKKTEISVDDAIKKGKTFVFNAHQALLLIFVIPGGILSYLDRIDDATFGWLALFGFIMAFLYWSVAATKWRIWAFSNVRNVHQLQTRALDYSIISEPGGFWEKMEFKTKKEKATWAKLKLKFEEPDVFEKPVNYPKSLKIYVSPPVLIFHLIISAILIVVLGLSIYEGSRDWILFLILFVIIFFAKDLFRQTTDKEPQIILSKQGIKTTEHPHYKWKQIKDFTIRKRMLNKSNEYYLEYHTPTKFVSICLRDLAIGIDDLREAFRIYGNKT